MRFVLDASITVNWAMPDESHPTADRAFDELDSGLAIVPSIWWYEVRNILIVNERRQRISPDETARFLNGLSQLDIEIHNPASSASILELSRRFNLTVYDAAYLALAQNEGVPLATLDKALRTAAATAGIPLLA